MTLQSIHFITPFDVPAPFSYEILFEFSSENNINFQMNYTGREDLTEDEILNEGFSENDDFVWKGKLNAIWLAEADTLLSKSDKRNTLADQEIILRAKNIDFAPRNYKEWSLLIQDLIQAVFETSGKEKPWQMDLQIIKNGKKDVQKMEVSFAKMEVDFAYGSVKMDWNKAKKMMELIYLGDFDEAKSSTKSPQKEGVYLCFDQLTWYKLSEGVLNPNGNKKYLPKLEFELNALI